MLILSRKVDEKIKIGNDITITLISIQGDQVKIGVEAPKSVKVFRQEVYNAIQSENMAAVVNLDTANQNAVTAISKMIRKS